MFYITSILELIFLYIPLLCGAYISISLMKIPDLSIESAYTFGAVLAARVMVSAHGFGGLTCALGCALVGGMCVGIISSVLAQGLKIPCLLTSIITLGLFHGIHQYVLGCATVSLVSFQENINFFVLLCIALCVLGIIAYILQTQLGYCFIVYGNNPLFFNYSLISGRFVFCAGIILAHACAGLSGYLVAQYNGFIDLGMGQGVTLLCISIIVLGKLFLSVRSKLLALVPMLGAISYFLLQRVLIKIGFDLKYFTLVQALLVLIIVVIGSFKKRAQNSVDTVDILGV